MSAPLGGIRRERKRLKRCAHRNLQAHADWQRGGDIMHCTDCGATAHFDAFRVSGDVREVLPPRIARKAADT